MRKHGETDEEGGRAWCASCNRWCEADGEAGRRMFVVEHGHGESVAARRDARKAQLERLRRDDRPVADVLRARAYLVDIARETEQTIEAWRVS